MQITDELEALTTEHRELNTSNYGHDDVCQVNDWAIGACEVMERAALHIRSLTKRLEKAEKDAARYLWLRDRGDETFLAFSVRTGYGAKKCDAAIDVAIAQEGADHE